MAVAYKEQKIKQGSQKTEKETMKENKDKNINDKNTEKRIFYVKLVHFIQCRAYFWSFILAIVTCVLFNLS